MKNKTKVTLTEKTITKQQAKKLAVSYSSFLEAMDDGDILGKLCYGRMLREIQNEINLYLMDKDLLETIISSAENIYYKGAAGI
jgi:hypothetical protein